MTRATLSLHLTAPFVVAFLALRYLFHEAHEFAHMTVARIACGVWGVRDFNNVQPIVSSCDASPATNVAVALAGPLLNYVAIWIGAVLLHRASTPAQRAWGFSLVFASLPFARLFTALVGSGDEMWVARTALGDPMWARFVCIVVIGALLAWPLYVAFGVIAPPARRVGYFAGFLLLPMLLEGAVVLFLFNRLLATGLLARPVLLGAPALVLVVLAIVAAIFAASASRIRTLSRA